MNTKALALFYTGAAMLFNLDSDEVDQILADAGLDAATDPLPLCREAIRAHVGPETWERGFESGRLLFGNGQLTVDDAPPGNLITLSEAARLRGVSLQAISQAVTRGTLKAYHDPQAPRHQGRRLVLRSDVEAM